MSAPCIKICKFDGKTGFCLGCGRTKKETKRWKDLKKSKRYAILEELPARLRAIR